MIQYIQEPCGLSSIKDTPTTLFEDNATYITQITGGIKRDTIKYISLKFLYTHELHKIAILIFSKYRHVTIWQIIHKSVVDILIQETSI